ncbi:hypothetical protein CHUAL_004438 [Chamberlinius hualienensis]
MAANGVNGKNEWKKKEGTCSVLFLSYVFFVFNILFMTSGCIVLGIGVWTVIYKHHFVSLLSSATYVSIAYILVFCGGVVLFIALMGFIGISKKKKLILLSYTFLLLLIFVMEAVTGIVAYVYEMQLRTELESHLNETFLTSYMYDDSRTSDIDAVQREFKCCGAVSFEDWRYSRWLMEATDLNNTVPDSCCISESPFCGVRDHPSNINSDSCIYRFEMQIKEQLIILAAIGLGISVVQIFGVILSCCLYMKLKDYEDRLY